MDKPKSQSQFWHEKAEHSGETNAKENLFFFSLKASAAKQGISHRRRTTLPHLRLPPMVGKHNVDCVTCWQKTVECRRWHGNRGQDRIMTGLLLRSVECRGRKVLVWRRRANSAASVNVCLEQRLRRWALDSTVGRRGSGSWAARSNGFHSLNPVVFLDAEVG